MNTPPGFFCFRWAPLKPITGFEDVAVVFKVPGSVDMAVLPDLIEDICHGPLVPTAVVFVHLKGDSSLVEAITNEPTQSALLRFDGRMPLAVADIDLQSFKATLSHTRGIRRKFLAQVRAFLSTPEEWLKAGLRSVFDPEVVIFNAPAGYAFHKPSNRRSTYFIRAETALTTSGAVSFVALAMFRRLLGNHGGLPVGLKVLFIDTMSVATTAYALRELLSQAGVSPLPQIDSFHSYGGITEVADPLPGSSLCIISASSSMSLHREWIEQKRLSDRDVLTLVTFEDAEDQDKALYSMPGSSRPAEPASSARYDIRIAGENFFPVIEPPRKVLLTTTKHACPQYTEVFSRFVNHRVFDVFRATPASPKRHGLFISGEALLKCEQFQRWVNAKLPHWLKAGTAHVIFQDDVSSRVLAQQIAFILVGLGATAPRLLRASEVSEDSIDADAAIVCVGAVISQGNTLLSLSRELRNCHRGPRLYVIGIQVAESTVKVATFDNNLKHSSHGACIDVLRMQTCLVTDTVADSFSMELATIYSSEHENHRLPAPLKHRAERIRQGVGRPREPILLPSGANLEEQLSLNEGFAFWPKGYSAGPYQAEVLGTMSAVLQNARTAASIPVADRLKNPMLMQVALDPENFARFNDGVIQAAILRAALPSELDYRGDADASMFMRKLLERMASRIGASQQAELEFLTALSLGRLRLNGTDTQAVLHSFQDACARQNTPLSKAVRFLLDRITVEPHKRLAF